MLYDTAGAPPTPESLLESIFIIISQKRRKAEFYTLRATILASLLSGPAATKELSVQLDEALKEVIETVIPFAAGKGTNLDDDAKSALKKWVESGPRSVRPAAGLMDTNSMKMASKLKRAKEKAASWKRQKQNA